MNRFFRLLFNIAIFKFNLIYYLKHFEMQLCLLLLSFPSMEYALSFVLQFSTSLNPHTSMQKAHTCSLCSASGPTAKQEAQNKVLQLRSQYCGKVLSQIWICVPRNQGLEPVIPPPTPPTHTPRSFFGMRLDRCDTLQCKRN